MMMKPRIDPAFSAASLRADWRRRAGEREGKTEGGEIHWCTRRGRLSAAACTLLKLPSAFSITHRQTDLLEPSSVPGSPSILHQMLPLSSNCIFNTVQWLLEMKTTKCCLLFFSDLNSVDTQLNSGYYYLFISFTKIHALSCRFIHFFPQN